MAGEISGEVLVDLDASTAAASASTSWIKITPRGKTRTRNGVTYDFNPEALEARFADDKVRIPIDFDHAIARLASQGHATAAVGWIEEMEARTDGLYGRVEWLEPGLAALAAKTHRYVSPTFGHDNGLAIWLHSVALVTAPALGNMPALADASARPATIPRDILAALSLPANAGHTQVLEAIGQMTATLAATVSGQSADRAIPQLLTDLAAARTQADSIRIEEKVESAVARGALPPYLKSWALAACSADEPGFDQLMKFTGTPLAYLMAKTSPLDNRHPSRGSGETVANESAKIAAQLGIDPKSLKTEPR